MEGWRPVSGLLYIRVAWSEAGDVEFKGWFFVRSDVDTSHSHVVASTGLNLKEPRTDLIVHLHCIHLLQLVYLSLLSPLTPLHSCRYYGGRRCSLLPLNFLAFQVKAPGRSLYPLAGTLVASYVPRRPRQGFS